MNRRGGGGGLAASLGKVPGMTVCRLPLRMLEQSYRTLQRASWKRKACTKSWNEISYWCKHHSENPPSTNLANEPTRAYTPRKPEVQYLLFMILNSDTTPFSPKAKSIYIIRFSKNEVYPGLLRRALVFMYTLCIKIPHFRAHALQKELASNHDQNCSLWFTAKKR